MRSTNMIASILSFIFLMGTVMGVHATTASPAGATVGLDPPGDSASRMDGIMLHFAEAEKTTLDVPAGHMLGGRIVDESFVLDVVPTEDVSVPLGGSTPTTIECYNDVLRPWGQPVAGYPLAPNPLAPLVTNVASQGMCDNSGNGGDTHNGPVTFLQFRTAGDWGGSVYLYGYNSDGDYGEYGINCFPTAAGSGVGAGEQWLTTLDIDNALCEVYKWGVAPSEYDTFNAYVYTWHWATGYTYASVN